MSTSTQRRAIIQVRDLRVGYPNRVLVENATFDILEGEVFGILGGSGCGKSTLLKHMMGLVPALSGSILIDGEDVLQASAREKRQMLRKLGVMYQNGALFGSLTLSQNVSLPLEEHTNLSPRAMELVAAMKLRLVGLLGFENYLPAEISGGMRKRAAIARAMALDPRILFLDEPSAGLDPITSADLDKLIIRLSEALGITFVIVSHELPSILAINDRVIMLDKASRSILAEGTPQELLQSDIPLVRRFFTRDAEGATVNEAGT